MHDTSAKSVNWREMSTEARLEAIRLHRDKSRAELNEMLGLAPRSKTISEWARENGTPLVRRHGGRELALDPIGDETATSPWGMSEDKRRAYFAKRAAEGARKTRAAQA